MIIVTPVVLTTAVAMLLLLRVLDNSTSAGRLDVIRTALTIGAGAGAVMTLVMTWRRQVTTEHDATERRLTELYVKAVEQLGSDKAAVRHGALYALERVAQDNPDHRQTIVNVICAYLRAPYTLPSTKLAAHRLGVPARRVTAGPSHEEREVRLTAQRILSHHLRPGGRLRRTSTFWIDIDLDLTGATLVDFTLHGCRLHTASFAEVTFAGDVDFQSATFTGDADFTKAVFTGCAEFQDARFTDAIFAEVTFASRAGFYFTRFRRANFTRATFNKTWFYKVTFGDIARFDQATFRGSLSFLESVFKGEARFNGALFSDDTEFSMVSFADVAWFKGIRVTGAAYFNATMFTDSAEFNAAEFGRYVSFRAATFANYAMFDGAVFAGATNFDESRYDRTPDFTKATFAELPSMTGALRHRLQYTGDPRDGWPIGWTAQSEAVKIDRSWWFPVVPVPAVLPESP